MKNIFQSVRALFGQSTTASEWQPIDELQKAINDQQVAQFELNKAVEEYDHINGEYALKLRACDVLIEKGEKIGEQNKQHLTQRLDGITDNFLNSSKQLAQALNKATQLRVQLESDIITKAVQVTSQLDQQDQGVIKDIIDVWLETGLVKGEQVESQAKAIVLALDEIIKGREGSRGGKVIGHTKSGKPVYEHKNGGEYDNFSKEDHYDAKKIHEKKAYHHYQQRDIQHFSREKRQRHAHKNVNHIERADSHARQAFALEKRPDERDFGGETTGIKKSHEPIAIENAGKGDVKYDNNEIVDHYANAIVKRDFKEGEKTVTKILFLRRASDKVVAPNQFCLPGGHIGEGETIEIAALRELKEEANMEASSCNTVGKARCDDGKWAYYVQVWDAKGDPMLLDGESVNAAWMCKDEWIEADLFFDLKDHLLAIETDEPGEIKDIMKAEKEVEMSWKEFRKEHKRLLDILENGSKEERKKEADRQRKEMEGQEEDSEEIEKGGVGSGKHKYAIGSKVKVKLARPMNQDKFDEHEVTVNHHDTSESGEPMYGGKNDKGKQKYFTDKDVIEKSEDDSGELEKAFDIDNPFYYESEEELIKGRAAAEGEIRVWGGKKYEKSGGEWMPVGSGKGKSSDEILGKTKSGKAIYNDASYEEHKGFSIKEHREASSAHVEKYKQLKDSDKKKAEHHLDQSIEHRKVADKKETDQYESTPTGIKKKEESKKHSTDQLTKHAENTSADQLKKVAAKKDHPHNDAAKRELERRAGEDAKKESDAKTEQGKWIVPHEKRLNNLLKVSDNKYSVDKIESIEMTPKGNYFINMHDRGIISINGSAVKRDIIDGLAEKYGFKIHE